MRVEIRLLGGFAVLVDGTEVAAEGWRRRHAAAVVKLLALTPTRRLHREQVVDALWPELLVDEALPRLHKAAHFARQTLGVPDAVVLRNDTVALFPDSVIVDDVSQFIEAADDALGRSGETDSEACAAALELWRGELLPEDLYAPWTEGPRRLVRTRVHKLLRCARRWEAVLAVEPADEEAHVELIREAVMAGDRPAALRHYDRMERVLREELGVEPGPVALALRERVFVVESPAVRTPDSLGRGRRFGEASRPGSGLLERDTELELLGRAVEQAVRDGRGTVVVVSGEAGSGKTALVDALVRQLADAVDVLVGGCDDLLSPRTLGPFRDMADGRAELADAFAAGNHDAVSVALLRRLAARPTVVVVEDVHWADDGTVDALRYLSRRIAGVPSVLIVTVRDDDVGAVGSVRQVVAGLGGASIRHIRLGPLSLDAVARLAGDGVDAAELHTVTKGNPFFVTEVLADTGAEVPATVRDAVLARVDRLAPATRALMEQVSVVPTRAERWLAEALASGQVAVLVDGERSGVLGGDTDHVAFRHELARRAVEAALTPGQRSEANRRVLDVLLARSDVEPSRLVHHAEHGHRVDVLLQTGPLAAAEAARLGSHRQCAETLRIVLEHSAQLDPSTTAELLTRRAYSLYVVNQFEASYESACAAVALAEQSADPVVLADALAVFSKAVFWARGPMAARAAASRAVDLLDGRGDDAPLAEALIDLARAHSNLATMGVVAERADEAIRAAQRALALGDELRRDDLRGQALCYLGSSRLDGHDPGGADDLERAIALTSTDARRELRVRGHVNASGSAYRAGRFEEAERHIAAGLRVAADGEFYAGEYRLRLTAAAVHATRGSWDEAISGLEDLLASAGDPGIMRPLTHSLLARLLARRGDERTPALLAAALEDPAACDDIYVVGPLAVAQVELAWLGGAGDSLPGLAAPTLEHAPRVGHRSSRAELVRYLQRAGHRVAAPPDSPEPWAAALAGRWSEAAAGFERLGDRYEAALERATNGDDSDARAAGLATLSSLGAAVVIEIVESADAA